MNIKSFILLIILTSFLACKAQDNIQKEKVLCETRNLLNSYLDAVADNNGENIQNHILHSLDNQPWADSLIPSHLWLVRNFNIKKKTDVIDFEKLFSDKDIKHLQSTSKKFSYRKWSKVINHPLLVENNVEGVLLSSPAFDKTFTYAIFYLDSNEGGSLIIFKKEGDDWVYFASGLVWIT